MSTDIQHRDPAAGEREPSMTGLISGIVADFEKLMGQQLALLRREVMEDVRQVMAALGMMAFGGAVVLMAGIALTFGLVHAVKSAFPDWSLEACFTLVGVCLAVIGGLLLYGGVQLLASINPVPTKSIEAMQENVQCLTTPQQCATNHPKTSSGR